MSDKATLLSIIIPTRNRIPFCKSAIETILNIPDTRFELVVTDNSDSKELKDFVTNRISDSRLKYHYTSEAFSTINNFNTGMELSTGEYVCFIGDDDGINPEIIEATAWAKLYNIDSLSWEIKASYLWPGSIMPSTFFTKVTGAELSIYPFTGKLTKAYPKNEIKKFLKSGGSNYLKFKLPKAYHGLVSRNCFNKVKTITGSYFGGLSPDINSSFAISLVSTSSYAIDYPLSIAGSSPVAEQTHNLKDICLKPMDEAPHFRNRGYYKWNELIPYIYTGVTIQLESGLACLNLMGYNDLIKYLSLSRMAAFCIMTYPQLKDKILAHNMKILKSQNKSVLIGRTAIKLNHLLYLLSILFERGWNRLLLIMGFQRVYNHKNLDNILYATEALTADMNEMKESFSKHVKSMASLKSHL